MKTRRHSRKIIKHLLIVLLVVINLFTLLRFLQGRSELTLWLNDPRHIIGEVTVTFDQEGIVTYAGARREGNFVAVRFHAAGRGETKAHIYFSLGEKAMDYHHRFCVNEIGTLTRGTQNDFNGWQQILLDSALTMGLVLAWLAVDFIGRIRRDLCSYETLFSGGLTLFILPQAVLSALLCIVILPNFRLYSAEVVLFNLKYVFELFLSLAVPVVILFSILLTVSNLMLVKREGFRKVNLLGIAISGIVIAGLWLCFNTARIVTALFPGAQLLGQKLQYVGMGLFSFLLCFMGGTMLCALIAARRVPRLNQDFILILGCHVRKDGSLPPLLRGRADRALWFWRRQKEKTGREAVLIPSGGQGSDEPMPEGEAIRRYLVAQGVPEEAILPETRSATTLENMLFSKELIEARKPDARVIYATTNYHVFRSGILAAQAGLKAKGIGSRTKWYFWPNAFVREFAGLLWSARVRLIALLAAAALLFLMISLLV